MNLPIDSFDFLEGTPGMNLLTILFRKPNISFSKAIQKYTTFTVDTLSHTTTLNGGLALQQELSWKIKRKKDPEDLQLITPQKGLYE
jgi:hypothetical protein